ncbi:BlaI/MecI/CopY family transcriptional regulator [Streptomyces silvisoli]|uniref:BlaI/MecI/CopY family transcriptional regulator n=1 Tax=Streptomyces silvisoli TaxID=3034235 RepID=A0ABT5ZPC8_9ACTN|nr:BlaI/MecI/CopY family transcriptional regulator [Streptomyces silvisoli]MDF3291566.1 BlaI/MecI/CopY family transcriptional regulator [Streptomyces silvisoli]
MSSRGEGAGAAQGGRRPAGALEAEVMAALWASGAPMTARQVQEALGEGLAYKTVLTVLGRLHVKGLLDREPVGRAHAYCPRRGPAQTAAQQMNEALSRGPSRTEVLHHFVENLDPDEQAALRELLGPGE